MGSTDVNNIGGMLSISGNINGPNIHDDIDCFSNALSDVLITHVSKTFKGWVLKKGIF